MRTFYLTLLAVVIVLAACLPQAASEAQAAPAAQQCSEWAFSSRASAAGNAARFRQLVRTLKGSGVADPYAATTPASRWLRFLEDGSVQPLIDMLAATSTTWGLVHDQYARKVSRYRSVQVRVLRVWRCQ